MIKFENLKIIALALVICFLASFSLPLASAENERRCRIHLDDSSLEWHKKENLTAKLVDINGSPIDGRRVCFYRRTVSGWKKLGVAETNENGVAKYEIFVDMKNGRYSFRAVFKGGDVFSYSSDTASIQVKGNIGVSLIVTALSLAVWGVKTVESYQDYQREKTNEYIKELEKEVSTWKKRAKGAPVKGYGKDYKKAKGHLNKFYPDEMDLFTVAGKAIAEARGGPAGMRIITPVKGKNDVALGRKLRKKGIKKWNLGDTEKERKRGAELYLMGTKLWLGITRRYVYDRNDYDIDDTVSPNFLNQSSDLFISATPTRSRYGAGEEVEISVNVINNKSERVEGWLGVSFKDKRGNVYHVSSKNVNPNQKFEIGSGEMKNFTVNWEVPKDAVSGQYEIAINGWKNKNFTKKYSDDFAWKKIFHLSEIDISVSPEKYWYQPGEKAKINIEVKNFEGKKNFWFDAQLMGPNQQLLSPKAITPDPDNVSIQANEEKAFTAEWSLPQNANLGEYNLFLNCYKEPPKPNICPPAYSDDFDSKVVFSCFNLDILSPTNTKPRLVGDPDNPAKFIVKATTGVPIPFCFSEAFDARIGNRRAEISIVSRPLNTVDGSYILQVTPPTQSSEGEYNLSISIDKGDIEDSDSETDAVVYSKGANVDVTEIIDRSGSMSGAKISDAKSAAKTFVNRMGVGDMIGIASYSSTASVDYGLTEITSDVIKKEAKSAIDGLSAGGKTSIGGGLRAGYNELSAKGQSGHRQAMVLMTDGHQNTPPHPDDVLPDIKDAGYKVFTVGIGSGAEQDLLSRIANETGGEYYYAPSSKELKSIYNSISGVVRAKSTVKRVSGSMDEVGETETRDVLIDGSISSATFVVTWSDGNFDLSLERPDGSQVDPSKVGSHETGDTYELFRVENPMDGEWSMIIETTATSSPVSYTASVTADTSVTMHAYLENTNYSFNEPVKITAVLAENGELITDANVSTLIDRPDGSADNLMLFDDGKHDDGVADDGVYANYYTNTGDSGSYSINVEASGTLSPEKFTRETTKSFYVSGQVADKITSSLKSLKAELGPSHDNALKFLVCSSSSSRETVKISATDLVNSEGDVIESKNLAVGPTTLTLPSGENAPFYGTVSIPKNAEVGIYTGSIILRSTANSVTIPVSVTVPIDTRKPSSISPSSASLSSEFILGGRNSVDVYFQYRKKGKTQWKSTDRTTYTTSGTHRENLSDLAPKTTYEYRAVFVGSRVYGDIQTFKTSGQASFSVKNLSVKPEKAEPGETVSITAKVKNTGTASGTYTANLRINGSKEDQDSVTLDSGESGTVSFQVSRADSGTYDVSLGGLSGSFEVLEPAEFRVSNLEISPKVVNPGGKVTISCLLSNTGGVSGVHKLFLRGELGREIDSKVVHLKGGESRKIEFTMSHLDPGRTYEIQLGNLSGEFRVMSAGKERKVPPKEEKPKTPYIGLVSLAISIAVIAFMLALIFGERKRG